MNKEPEISIILAAYNMEKYLRQAIDSVLVQEFTDWECILVDDGSNDSSPKICDEYANKDRRIKVIHKPNGGLSDARNAGMAVMRGKYVTFLDADDWMAPTHLSTLRKVMLKYDADMVQGGFWKEYKHFTHVRPLVNEEKLISGNEIFLEFTRQEILTAHVWNKLFRREIIKSPFPKGKLIEDIYALTDWLQNADKIAVTPEPVYHYRMRRGSIMHSNFAECQFDYVSNNIRRTETAYKLFPELFQEWERNKYHYIHAVKGAKMIARREKNPEKRRKSVMKISDMLNNIPEPPKGAISRKYAGRASLLKSNPEHFIRVMRLSFMLDLHTKLRDRNLYD